MDVSGRILRNGGVLVRDGMIVATWQGARMPEGTLVGDAIDIDLGPRTLIFPGLLNLHNHPTYNMLQLWPAPSSHAQPSLGRPLGTEPYANRYQWNRVGITSPPAFRRLVDSPQSLLISPILEIRSPRQSSAIGTSGSATATDHRIGRHRMRA